MVCMKRQIKSIKKLTHNLIGVINVSREIIVGEVTIWEGKLFEMEVVVRVGLSY